MCVEIIVTVQEMLIHLTKNLREIVGQYGTPEKLSSEERQVLSARFRAVLQHYMWKNNTSKHPEVKYLYKKLCLCFHPDKYDFSVNENEATLIQKKDVQIIASYLNEDNNVTQSKEAFFKLINDAYTEDYNRELQTLDQALKKQAPKPPMVQKKTTATSTASTQEYKQSYQQPRYQHQAYQSYYQYQQPRYHYQAHQNYYQQYSYNPQYEYKPREYTEEDIFLMLETVLCKSIDSDIDNYVLKLGLENILERYLKKEYYEVIDKILRCAKVKLDINLLNQYLEQALVSKNIAAAKIFIRHGANNVGHVYASALKSYDDELLYTLFEALPDNHKLKNGDLLKEVSSTYDCYYLNKLRTKGIISAYAFSNLSLIQKQVLNNGEIYELLEKRKISLEQALNLTLDEVNLIQYPGFNKYLKSVGNFNQALINMKKKRSILNEPVIRQLANTGVINREIRNNYFTDYEPIALDYLLRLGEGHIQNLNDSNIFYLIERGTLFIDEVIGLDNKAKERLKSNWVREAIRDASYNEMQVRHGVSAYQMLSYIYHLEASEFNHISECMKHFPYLSFNSYNKLPPAQKKALLEFMPIIGNYSHVEVLANGFSIEGLSLNTILNLSSEMIQKLSYSLSPELYFKQGKMGQYLLNHFPVSFFEENKTLGLEALLDQALFYASSNDMPEFIDLYAANHNNLEGHFFKGIYAGYKNCLHLYTLTNQKKQTLEDVAVENKAMKSADSLKYNTYYFDTVYQATCCVAESLKATATSMMKAS